MFFEPPERLTCGCYFGVSGAWCPCWKKPKLSLIRALNWSKIRNLLWCNFVHFKVQSCTGVTFLVVVCGNSNEKDTDKQAKRRNYFLSRKVELTLYYYTAPLMPCPHVSVLVFFFSRFGLPSTCIREKRSPKTHLFKNVLQRGDFRISRFLVYVWTDENGGFPIR